MVAAVLFIPSIVLALRHGIEAAVLARAFERTDVVVAFTISGFVAYFALTFVTPALALTTNWVGDALRIGLRLLRRKWPRSAWYALIPSLGLLSVMSMRRGMTSDPFDAIGMTFAGVHTILALWFKGATVGFYDRHVLTNQDIPATPPV